MKPLPTPNMNAKPNAQNKQRAQAGVDDALLQDVDDLTGTGEARLEHHEAGLHEEHQERGDQHPRRVGAVDDAGDLVLDVVGGLASTTVPTINGPTKIDHPEGGHQPHQLAEQVRHEEPLAVAIAESRSEGECVHSFLRSRPGRVDGWDT